jgi:2-C-methyl-D-erythritol 4-phosphate cytidylyltransferase / 2-C-methyl-D-erythritol 2,4-cyclodiphosphate synthase
MSMPRTAAIIVAAGTGSRFGADTPKQYMPLGGQVVLAHSYNALCSHPAIATVLVVIAAGQEDLARSSLGPDVSLVLGGDTRRASVRNGLETLTQLDNFEAVLIHDAARPFLGHAVIDRLLSALVQSAGAVPALPVVDTLARYIDGCVGDAVGREGLLRVQTPQAFHFSAILSAHRNWDGLTEPTDDASMMRHFGHAVAAVAGDVMLEKITHGEDLIRAERLINMPPPLSPRTGMGYDVHRLVAGEELWMGGILVPHDKGLSGHSDADVAIHALVDALLGALAEGDIGSHFPPSDPQWRGAPSSAFLTFARDKVKVRGGTISHVDLTLICEAPKIGPHRDRIRLRLAQLLEIDMGRVSVKATTTERLGFAGRGEGIAAHAIATILLPDL